MYTNYYHEKFPIVRDMIHVLYEYEVCGGCCHVVVDDDNIYDSSLDCVINYCKDQPADRIDTELCIAIATAMKSMTFLQRAVLFDSMEKEIEYSDKEDFDCWYPHTEEYLKEVIEKYDYRGEFH